MKNKIKIKKLKYAYRGHADAHVTYEGEEPANAGDGSPHDTVGISGVTNNYNNYR